VDVSQAQETTILVVEDDEGLRELLLEELAEEGFCTKAAGSAEEARTQISEFGPGLVISDLRLPGADGLELLGYARTRERPPGFIIVTGFGTVSKAVEALKAGADDFLTKPLDLDHLKLKVSRVIENRTLKDRLDRVRDTLEGDHFHGLLGQSPGMRHLYDQVRHLARADGPVLITGESGTGKELVARAVYQESARRDEPFIAVNCAGIPTELLESEFFGHVSGAFTGAQRPRDGLFVEAHGGSLFLDEISEVPLGLQPKLLRVLEDGNVRPVGGNRERRVDVRILAATNDDLEEAVKQGRFREDLFYRLETFILRVPPLRQRDEDLDILIGHFLHRYCLQLNKDIRGVSAEAMERLHSYTFPGNVRELKNALERAVAFCDENEIRLAHLPKRIREFCAAGWTSAWGPPPQLASAWTERLPPLREMERLYVNHVLESVDGNKRRAAGILGIGRRTLYRYLKKTGR
jgi:DNA-binding NtrC family response regulator